MSDTKLTKEQIIEELREDVQTAEFERNKAQRQLATLRSEHEKLKAAHVFLQTQYGVATVSVQGLLVAVHGLTNGIDELKKLCDTDDLGTDEFVGHVMTITDALHASYNGYIDLVREGRDGNAPDVTVEEPA